MRRVLFLSLIFGFVFLSGAWCIDDPNNKISIDDPNYKILIDDPNDKILDDNFKIVVDDSSKDEVVDYLSKNDVVDDSSKFSDDNFKILDECGEGAEKLMDDLGWTEVFHLNQEDMHSACYVDGTSLAKFCYLKKCYSMHGDERGVQWVSLLFDDLFDGGVSFEEACLDQLMLDDCRGESEQMVTKLRKLGGVGIRRLDTNLDALIREIRLGIANNAGKADHRDHCYLPGSDGDNVWHALLHRVGEKVEPALISRFEVWGEGCLKMLKNDEQKMGLLYSAAFLDANNEGDTPIALAIRLGSLNVFSVFRDYFEENNINYNSLIREAASEAGVSYRDLLKAFKNGTEL